MILLATLRPFDPVTGSQVAINVGVAGKGDAVRYYQPVMAPSFEIERTLFGHSPVLWGSSEPEYGKIEIENEDGRFDVWQRYEWTNRLITILIGDERDPIEKFRVLLWSFSVEAPQFDEKKITIIIGSLSNPLDKDIHKNFYKGDNVGISGHEGEENLAGTPKPRALGYCRDISPVLVNEVSLTYQVNDGPIADISVMDDGNPLTNVGDISSLELDSVDNWESGQGGEFITDLANGKFRCWSKPVDLSTTFTGKALDGTMVFRHGDIAQSLAKEAHGYSIDESVEDLADSDSSVSGVYMPDVKTYREALDSLAISCGAYWFVKRGGGFGMSQIHLPEPGLSIDREIDSVKLLRRAEPYDTVKIQFGEPSVSSGAMLPKKNGAASEYGENNTPAAQFSSGIDTAVVYLGAENPPPFPSHYMTESGALAECQRRASLFNIPRNFWKITGRFRDPSSIEIGQSVTITWPRFGMETGKNYRVLGVKDRYRGGHFETEIVVWG